LAGGGAAFLISEAVLVGAKAETFGGLSGRRGRTSTGMSPSCSKRSNRPERRAIIGSSRTATLRISLRDTRAIRSTPMPWLMIRPLLKA
jgi:hypothetical protein